MHEQLGRVPLECLRLRWQLRLRHRRRTLYLGNCGSSVPISGVRGERAARWDVRAVRERRQLLRGDACVRHSDGDVCGVHLVEQLRLLQQHPCLRHVERDVRGLQR